MAKLYLTQLKTAIASLLSIVNFLLSLFSSFSSFAPYPTGTASPNASSRFVKIDIF